MKNYLSEEGGFSLVEMLVYMGIFSILLVSLVQLFGSILDVKFESQATSSVTQDGRYIILRLSYDIHRAISINSPALGTQDSNLVITIDSTNYTYSLNGDNNLEVKNNTTNEINQLNSADTTVSNLSFTTLGNSGGKSTVKISLELKSKVIRSGGSNQIETFKTTIGTR